MPKETFFKLPEEKRRRIVELALHEFASHPYREASLSRLVRRAGIAKGSVYQYFRDKFDLYLYLVRRLTDAKRRLVDEDLARLGPEAGLFERLLAATEASLRLAEEQPELYALGQHLVRETDRALLERVMAELGPEADLVLLAWIAEAKERGDLRPSVRPEVVQFIFSAVSWQASRALVEGVLPPGAVRDLMREVFDVLENGVRPRKEGDDRR
ncbi:MAG: TetR/AcrR family transcriptional regulator [Firmicutes bacterium]|nr:TetR/AcrR family transcriptional regulator [Bacillota bacterium]